MNTVELRRQVAVYGSILLAELVAMPVVLEYVLTNFMNGPYKQLREFCDSQSAVGILTLNWNKNNYRQLVGDIKHQVNRLEEQGWTTDILWSPGHAEVLGNEIADILAKEAATEAAKLPEDTRMITN